MRMDSSGMASSAVLLTVIAVGAAASVGLHSEPEQAAPMRVVHRGPPGPAQIELAEAGSTASAKAVPQPVALFGVDVARAISVACGDSGDSETFTPEGVVCALAAQTLRRVPKVHSEYVSLLLPSG